MQAASVEIVNQDEIHLHCELIGFTHFFVILLYNYIWRL